ncbi:MAG: multicopper oxidase domain-containing protein [Desulfobulbaceae bacterium]
MMKAAEAIFQPSISILAPISPTDQTKVPHYFGPFPNWANSPFTLPDIAVTITGDGTGATAMATVGGNGSVTGITITNPGSGYTTAAVNITGGGTGAAADAVINTSAAVVAVNVDMPGAGYTAPLVAISGGGATTDATATVYGGVDAVTLTNGGAGYTFPTVDFDMPDNPDGVPAVAHAEMDANGVITAIVVDDPGSGYSFAPNVVIRDGTLYDPIIGGTGATATATLLVQTVALNTYGAGYTSAPTVTITDTAPGTGAGAMATATTDAGAITAINLTAPGSGYITAGGVKKFQDSLPQLCDPSVAGDCAAKANNLGQYIPLAVPDTTTFSAANGFTLEADYYVIAVVQTRERMSSSLPAEGTLLREYVQLETPANADWSKHIPLMTEMLDGTSVPALMPDGTQAYAVDDPHFLGPIIATAKDKPVRIVFYNLLPTGSTGDLFLPTDSTIMGSGLGPIAMAEPVDAGTVLDEVRNPLCSESPKADECFKDNRATLHLHGGITPWISDGTPHQWITPFNETTSWPEGVSVGNVPDMASTALTALGVPDCTAVNDGCQTFYYTNQQSARLMFYHDHAWGITRLNVYAGEAAGYLITDPTDQKLIADGVVPADQIPLIIQDRTFLPAPAQLAWQDPTWDTARWGGQGNFWYHHVYMPAQNPGDPGGMSAFGRWMYGPWFWPPATPPHGPIANPYHNPNCNLDDPATWQYQTDPFCEPPMMPGTPNISVGMEQFNDTPIVNGTAYPTVTVDPKSYRLRILNAANDRFWNLQLYVADPGSEFDPAIGPTEVALNPAELAAAQLDPVVFPTPDTSVSPPGPTWIHIGSEGGFLPAPVVVPNQPITWITDPTVFNVGNVDQHSLLLAPAERADVIVDFSQYAGQTLILYNDAPAAFPARVPSYDYYTGAPDLMPVGAPAILPGYGPNTRTIMQIKVAATAPAPAFDLAKLQAAFRHKANGSGVFESGQHPIIVGQAAYNSAYGTSFAASSYCNGGNTTTLCDGYLRIADQGGTLFGFNTLLAPTTKLEIPIEPKGIHDEMNASAFDEFGRMTANIGLEVVPATPALQNIVLYPYTNPPTELIDATNLPKGEINMTPIASADGTQIWKITHNGVDTHPIHWHLYDVQVLNRVTWDNIISPPDPSELGWKDTLRVSPLEDTIVALRPIVPILPFELPNSIRPLNPMMPIGSMMGFNNTDAAGNPTAPIVNKLVNFGWEYVWHCHILSHEEMDMMRPVAVAIPPKTPTGLTATVTGSGRGGRGRRIVALAWTDNSLTETQFLVQRQEGTGAWVTVATLIQPLNLTNTTGRQTYVDQTVTPNQTYTYRVVAENTVGYGGEYMGMTVQSVSNTPTVTVTP